MELYNIPSRTHFSILKDVTDFVVGHYKRTHTRKVEDRVTLVQSEALQDQQELN